MTRSRSPLLLLALTVLAVTVPAGRLGAQEEAPPAAAPLVVATKVAAPFAMKVPDASGTDAWRGISIELWKLIAQQLGREYTFVETDLQGLIDGLVPGEDGKPMFDASVAALTITADRERVMDFSQPFQSSGLAIAVPVERASALWTAIRAVFNLQFLQGVAALAAILLATGALVWWLEREKNEEFGGTTAEGVGSGFWWSAVTMTTVGYGDKAPKTVAGRVVALVWMFASIITISGFTAAIASSLTVTNLEGRIRGPEDLPKVRVATVANSAADQWLVKRGIARVQRQSLGDALDAVRAGGAQAVVYDAPILKYEILQSEDGALRVLPPIFDDQSYAIGLPTDSPLQEEINVALIGIVRSDEWRAILERYLGADEG